MFRASCCNQTIQMCFSYILTYRNRDKQQKNGILRPINSENLTILRCCCKQGHLEYNFETSMEPTTDLQDVSVDKVTGSSYPGGRGN